MKHGGKKQERINTLHSFHSRESYQRFMRVILAEYRVTIKLPLCTFVHAHN